MSLSDKELLTQFQDASIAEFHHADHVRVAWLYLREYSITDALAQFTLHLKRFAEAKGKPGLYHATITWAFFFLIHQRMDQTPADHWGEFAEANPDLLDWKNNILKQYYENATLQSEQARKIFLLPSPAITTSANTPSLPAKSNPPR